MNLRICLVLLTVIFSACANKEQAIPEKPNLIFIYADDWGYGDLGVHGSSFCKTPNLDKMAQEGIDFQNFSVCNPVCSPSRTAIMTGHFPARHSVHGHFADVASHIKRNMPDWLDPKEVMLPRLLKEAGYATGHFGKWHLSNTHVQDGPSPVEYGYDEFACFNITNNFKQEHPDNTLPQAIDFVERHKDEPFFVNVWIHATHTPHYPKERFLKQFAHLDEQQQVYAAVIAEADEAIGKLFDKLKELGIDEKTLVVFSSDNGPEITGSESAKWLEDNSTGPGMGHYYSVGETHGLKGRKRSLTAGGVRVPFLVRWPGVVPAGEVNKMTALAGVDILPTFAELAGAELPEAYVPDGESIVKAMKGEAFKRNKTIYWQWLFSASNKDFWASLAIQEDNWKMLINEKTGRRELYNITEDWAEANNVIEQYPEKAQELENKMMQWKETLPKNPPADCVSKERERLLRENK